MRDDFAGPVWAENHARLSGAIRAAIHKLGEVFEELAAQQFTAPWQHRRG